MKTTVLMAGLVAALAGTAVLAQVATTPDDAATAAPETASPNSPGAPAVPEDLEDEAAGMGPRGMGPEGRGPGDGVPNMGPLSIEAFDADGDGLVTAEEVEAHKAARFAQADADGDGGLSAEELVVLEEIIRDEARAQRASALVERMDDDGDGLLQAAEIEARTPRLQPILDRLDADGDAAISQEELDAARPARGEGRGFMGWGHGDHEGRGGRGH